MAIYDSCSACSGYGSFKCVDCHCSICRGSKTEQKTCKGCEGKAKLTCSSCSGSGRVLKKKTFFFGDTYEECGRCDGTRSVNCTGCKGTGTVQTTCSACQGTGANTGCPKCKGQGKTACSSCGGSGQVRPNWSRERIRDEIDRRKDGIAELKEAIDFHLEQYELRPQDGFQGRDLETRVYELKQEIEELRNMLH